MLMKYGILITREYCLKWQGGDMNAGFSNWYIVNLTSKHSRQFATKSKLQTRAEAKTTRSYIYR